jgi:hypothetical protein
MDKTFRQKISTETKDLNNTTGQTDLLDVYRTLNPTARE